MAVALLLGVGQPVSAGAEKRGDRAELYHRLVRIGREAEDPRQAAQALATAARIDPKNAQAHLLLAELFFQAGQTRRAETYLRGLIKQPGQRENADVYLQGLDRLALRQPVLLSGSFVLRPTSNVNNVSSERHFDTLLGRFNISEGGAEEFGIGAEVGGNLSYRLPLGTGRSLVFGGGLSRGLYKHDRLRFWRARLSADLKQIGPSQDWRLGIFASRKRYSDIPDSSAEVLRYGVRANFSTDLTAGRRFNLGAVVEQRDYLNTPTFSGPVLSLNGSFRTIHSKGRVSTLGLRLERRDTELDYHRYWGVGVQLGGETKVTDHLRMGLNAGLTIRQYDAHFAALDYARRDRVWTVGLSAIHRKISVFGATPKVSCSYERQRSNVALYSRETTACELGWFYQF